MTKEEILYCSESNEEGQGYYTDRGNAVVDIEDAYKAMEKFAEQEAIGFFKFCEEYNYHLTIAGKEIYQLYLKSKQLTNEKTKDTP